MRKKKKSVFAFYRYTEGGSMEAYLEEMARKGWHFVEWRLGMVFEKGAPEDVIYDVEVFSGGRETDQRPGEEAEEYGEYCEAAGWQLVDARRKFCVFRQIRKDTVPIVTPEEKFTNAWKAELACRLRGLVWCLLILGLRGSNLFLPGGYANLFRNLFLATLLGWTAVFVLETWKLLALAVWCLQRYWELKMGKALFFGSRNRLIAWWQRIRIWGYGVPLLFVMAVLAAGGYIEYIQVLMLCYIVIFALEVGEGLWKPSREKQVNLLIIDAFCTLAFVVLIFSVVGYREFRSEAELARTEPLTVTAPVQARMEITYDTHEESIFGEHREVRADYWQNTASDEGEAVGDLLVSVYESDFRPLLEACWDDDVEMMLTAISDLPSETVRPVTELTGQEIRALEETLKEQLQARKVELAVGNDLLRIGVFFPDKVFYVSSDTTWDPEELIELGNCLARSVY